MKDDWAQQHQAIKDLMDYLDKTIPTIKAASTAGSLFMGAAALYRCNRLLRAIDDAVERGLGDTAGGNVRTLYETWVLGHLLMLSGFDDARELWAMTRGKAETLLRKMGVEDQVEYPSEAPESTKDKGIEQHANALGKKLETEDPDNASMPVFNYNHLYRAESHLSSHANVDAINQYAEPVGEDDGFIGINGKNEGVEWRTQMAAFITAYFASQVFKKAGVDVTEFHKIEERLGPPKPDKETA
ncbi:MAG TPA: hypothetical protein VLG11_02685 [Candidatus Saccharimonadales bacterium]|nr:hypothetical protein [Candidatus Saccharimonadales bacterium]